MAKPALASVLVVTAVGLFSACYGTSSEDEDAAGGDSGAGGTAGSSRGGSGRGGTGTAGSSTAGSSGDAGADSGGASSGGTNAGGSSAGSGGTVVGDPPPWELWQACEVAEDCTVIPINGCCGCQPTGVNKEYEDDALATNANFDGSQCPPGLGCPSQPCPPDSMVTCETGVCVPQPGCSERSEQDCDLDAKCEKYQARLCSMAGDFAYFTCGKPKGACDESLTCMVSPFGQEVLFPNSCVPDGYIQPCVSQCE